MDPRSGDLYAPTQYEALTPERQQELVEIIGTPEQVALVAGAVRNENRRRNKAARKARRVTRRKT